MGAHQRTRMSLDHLDDTAIDAMSIEQLREQLKSLRDQYHDRCRRVCDECCLETANWAYDEDRNVVCTACAGEPKCEYPGCESTDVYVHSHALCDEHSRDENGAPHCPRDHSDHKADPCDVCDERWAALDDGEPPEAPFSAEELARK